MLHILLMILKIIGIILLVLLAILVSLLLIVLFVPIRYRVKGSKEDAVIVGKARVSWVFGLAVFIVSYQEKDVILQLKVLGIDLMKLLKKKTSNKKTASKMKKTDKGEKIEDTKDKKETVSDATLSKKTSEKVGTSSKVPSENKGIREKIKDIRYKITAVPGKIAESIKKIKLTITNICDKIKYWKDFLSDERVMAALGVVKLHLLKILKHILPKKIKGQVVYGFEDPCTTGQVLAGISVLYPVYYKHLSISPDFSGQILNGNIDFKGRIYVVYLLKSVLAVFFHKNIQFIIHIFRNKEES